MKKAVVIVVIIRPKEDRHQMVLFSNFFFTNFYIYRHVLRKFDFSVYVRNAHEQNNRGDFVVRAVLADDPLVISQHFGAASIAFFYRQDFLSALIGHAHFFFKTYSVTAKPRLYEIGFFKKLFTK